jgi:hypothetical protein
MKKITSLFFMALCLFSANNARADLREGVFSEPNAAGKTIFYQTLENNQVEVTFDGEASSWDATNRTYYSGDIVIPSTVTHEGTQYTVIGIGDVAFAVTSDRSDNELLTSITLPNTCQYIGKSETICFFWQRKLKEIIIPDNVTYIDDAAFRHCSGLESITIGAGITDLTSANGIFNLALGADGDVDVCKVKKVTVRAITPPRVNYKTFLGIDMPNIFLLVPLESIDAYKNHTEDYGENSGWFTGWSLFGSIYPIGTCLPILNLQAKDVTGIVTWEGDASAYDIVFSTTELEDPSTGDVQRATENTYNPEAILEEEGVTYYVYVRAECDQDSKSEWRSASFFYGQLCDEASKVTYTLKATDFGGYGWSDCNVKIYQNNGQLLVATIPNIPNDPNDDSTYGFGYEAEYQVRLCPDTDTRLVWAPGIYEDYYTDLCGMELKNPEGEVIYSVEAGGLATAITDEGEKITEIIYTNPLYTFTTVSSTAINEVKLPNANIAPTLSAGFVTVNAEAGTVAKVTDLTGRLLKSETITRADQKIALNYANGIYLITLENGHSRLVQKVILKK